MEDIDYTDSSVPIKKRIDHLESLLLKVEAERNRFLGLKELCERCSEPYHPSVADVEIWEECDRPGAYEEWEKEGGGFTWKEDENGYPYIKKEMALKESEEYEQFCKEYVFEMTKKDWLKFYNDFLWVKNKSIRHHEHELKKLQKTRREQQEEVENKNRFKGNKPHKDEVYKRYWELRGNEKYDAVKPSFFHLKDELKDAGWDPEDYGLKDEPYHFNKAANDWKTNHLKKSTSQN